MIRRTMGESYGRPRFIWPAFIIALLLGGYILWRQNGARPLPLPQVINGPAVQRTLLPSRLRDPAPSPDFVLSHLRELKLPEKARTSLEELSRK